MEGTIMKTARQKGFTLIELLVVIGILAVLLAITLIAINPAKQFAQANNTQRSSDVSALLNAIHQYAVDFKGDISALNVPDSVAGAAVIGDGVGEVDLCALVPEFLAALPVDPQSGATPVDEAACTAGGYATGYNVVRSATHNRITVAAPSAELSATIQATR